MQIKDFQERLFLEQVGVPPQDVVGLVIDEVSFLTPEVVSVVCFVACATGQRGRAPSHSWVLSWLKFRVMPS
jgi:hypothetical protein